MEQENEVRDNPEQHRFELPLGEGRTAFIDYTETPEGALALTHTEVPEEFEGQGIGSRLVKGTFEIVRGRNQRIVPMCGFVAAYLKRHTEYQSLVASASE